MTTLKGQVSIVTVIIALVSAVIGFVIVDEVITPTANEYQGTAQQITMSTAGVSVCSGQAIVGGSAALINATDSADTLTENTDYTISGCYIVSGAGWNGNAVNITSFRYYPNEYYNSSLSRTVVSYIVPIGLLGVIAMAAFLATR